MAQELENRSGGRSTTGSLQGVANAVPRVRFAPSPTGMFHVGNARSVLVNWVVARQSGGTMVLRIEDTDAARSRPEWVRGIVDAMAWLGIGPDEYEGPLFQSGYAGHHRDAIERLLAGGLAYYCECSREQTVARTGSEHKGYDGFCRDRSLSAGGVRAVRFRTPDEGVTVVVDLVRGKPTFDNALIEDFVIARGDGSPVFLLANAVDDIVMDHPCHPCRGAPAQRAEAAAVVGGVGRRAAGVGALADPGQREAPEGVQAPRPARAGGLPRGRLSRRGGAQLPDAARLGTLGRSGDRAVAGHRRGVPARRRQPVPGVLRREEAAGVQRCVHPGAAGRPFHRGVPAVASRRGRPVTAGGVRRDGLRGGRGIGADPRRGAVGGRADGGLPVLRPAADR